MPKALSEILEGVAVSELRCPAVSRRENGDPLIKGIAYDSRSVEPGYLFFALPGLHEDGRRFIEPAIAAGAVAIVYAGSLDHLDPAIAYVRVEDPRFTMSPVAANFYGRPSRDLTVIGVTGTEGKSTTVYLIYQLLRSAGLPAGFFSTVMSDSGQGLVPNPEHQTTPEAPTVQRMLASMRDAGYRYAVIEASSHGLSPRTNRLGDVDFDAGVMTNVTREHLEFHGTWERYRADKAELFRAIGRRAVSPSGGAIGADGADRTARFGVVNDDDPSAGFFRSSTAFPVRSFSAAGQVGADLSAADLLVDETGESFTIVERSRATGATYLHSARLELPGAFNVGNALAALLAVSGIAGIEIGDLAPYLPGLKPLRGRMTTIDRGQGFEVIVDYAHTPSSFQTVFPPLRGRVKGRMICVFGSGGERDVEKRPKQGRIAADWFDIVILADEDPRGENPMALLEEIAAGCPELVRGERLYLIPDRPSAIRKAFSLARPGDLVALLGKGHENSIIYAKSTIPYDEIGEAVTALAELGYIGSKAESGFAEAQSASAAELRSANKEDRKQR